jgi:hypothetical protein
MITYLLRQLFVVFIGQFLTISPPSTATKLSFPATEMQATEVINQAINKLYMQEETRQHLCATFTENKAFIPYFIKSSV